MRAKNKRGNRNQRKAKKLPEEQEKRSAREEDVRRLNLADNLPGEKTGASVNGTIAFDFSDNFRGKTSAGMDGTVIAYFPDSGLAEARTGIDRAIALDFADLALAKTGAGIDGAVAIKFANGCLAKKAAP